jgi:hypothetical protein
MSLAQCWHRGGFSAALAAWRCALRRAGHRLTGPNTEAWLKIKTVHKAQSTRLRDDAGMLKHHLAVSGDGTPVSDILASFRAFTPSEADLTLKSEIRAAYERAWFEQMRAQERWRTKFFAKTTLLCSRQSGRGPSCISRAKTLTGYTRFPRLV